MVVEIKPYDDDGRCPEGHYKRCGNVSLVIFAYSRVLRGDNFYDFTQK